MTIRRSQSCPEFGDEAETYMREEPSASHESRAFEIPSLPSGQHLMLRLISNWGNENFIALCGLEIFTENGSSPEILKVTELPEHCLNRCKEDPTDFGGANNLLDNVYRTKDDAHAFIRPHQPDNPPLEILIELSEPVRLAMLRFWNYNKSRIYADRGVKSLEICLDSNLIFAGELAKAPGVTHEYFGDIILFTTDDEILEKIVHNDWLYAESEEGTGADGSRSGSGTNKRPTTGEIVMSSKDNVEMSEKDDNAVEDSNMDVIDLDQHASGSSPRRPSLNRLISVQGSDIVVKGRSI